LCNKSIPQIKEILDIILTLDSNAVREVAMAYTETTSTNWFQRLGSSFGGIGFGIVLFLGGSYLLYHNEGDYVFTGDAITEAQSVVEELPDITKVDSSFNGKLIHAIGMAETKDTLTDGIFGVQTVAVKLQRKSEYYQWDESSSSETKQKLGGGEETVTTYSYVKKWVSSPIDSGAFKDPEYQGKNSVLATIPPEATTAPNVTFGAYTLPPFLKEAISGDIPINVQLTEEKIAELTTQINPSVPDPSVSAQYTLWGGQAPTAAPQVGVHVQGNTIYIGMAPASPKIGDVRVSFTEVKPAQISIIAKITGNTFEKYKASNNKQFSAFAMGDASAENMFGDAVSSNATWTWIWRVVGIIIVISGLKVILAPLAVIASVIPLLGNIIGAGTGIVSTFLGLAWSFLVISVAWLRFRPLIGGALILVAVALLVVLYKKGHKQKAAELTT
jgi:hypothetical protein